jgi:peptide-methionine (S)-S-oxide reductase
MSWFGPDKRQMVDPADALPGRRSPLPTLERSLVNGRPLKPPFPDGLQTAVFGMGCFWGAERLFWNQPGVWVTAVGYSGGYTPNPTYEETCTNLTGHAEVVLVVFDPAVITYEQLVRLFWEEHDPTQRMRQGNDVGTTYRSAIYYVDESQRAIAEATRDSFQQALTAARKGEITTEIAPLGAFYYAEDYHQQYLHRIPNGYCSMAGTGVSCPTGLGVSTEQR